MPRQAFSRSALKPVSDLPSADPDGARDTSGNGNATRGSFGKSSCRPDLSHTTVDGEYPVKSLLRLLRRRPGRISLAIGAFIVKEVPLWFLPVITAKIIDIVAKKGSISSVLMWFAVAMALLAQNYPNHLLYTRNFMAVVRDTGADLRNALAQQLQRLSIGFHTRASSSVVQNKVVRDVENIELMLQQVAHPLMSAIMVMVGATSMTAIMVPQFLPVYLLTVPLALLVRHTTSRRARVRNERFRREMEGFAARVGEMAMLIPVTRAHGLERTAVSRVAAGADGVRREAFQLDMLNGRTASMSWVTMQFLGVTCLVLAAVCSLTKVLPITPGEVVLLSSYFALLTQGLIQLLGLIPVTARGVESVRSIAEVLQEPDLEHNAGKHTVDAVNGQLTLERVTHRHPGASQDSVREVDLDIRPGETIAFVGPSGAGKSTLLNLVLGFIRPSSGRILLDGVDMQQLDLRTARRFVSVVPQESVLFEGSIRENVTYGLEEVTDDRLREALRDANALEIVENQPEGWDTVVGERGARLSGGQRQRIAIARALIRDPRILLLDEATSALDPEAETKVKQALGRLMRGRTTLVVAHRLSTIRQADRIVVLEGGRVVEIGRHDELITRQGRYSALHTAQAS